ncbi:MAG TPA: IS481 family transposase [Dermatophilaceae bacterium]|nr:IS481 family transposase [Dermatophilaceae bacterium]
MLLELSVVEQRYHAVLEVLGSLVPVAEVAERYGVSRQSVHTWVRRYQQGGLAGLADRSHRPRSHPFQLDPAVAAVICQLRRDHPRWGPRRLLFELGERGVTPVPSRSTVYRVLVREHLVDGRPRRRPRSSFVPWQRDAPMELWQLDITGKVWLADGRELKLVTGIDDHSRFVVLAAVVPRATGRAVCAAFVAALAAYGCPEQVLTDNGKQFTGKFNRPRPAEVLFDRICRKNGIEHLLTAFRHPTTTGKIERWHQTLQREWLEDQDPCEDLAAAQAMVDAFRLEYNTRRPHQALDMATPASRFAPVPPQRRTLLPLWLPAVLQPEPAQAPEPGGSSVTAIAEGLAPASAVSGSPGRGQGRSSAGRSTLTPPADSQPQPAAAASPDPGALPASVDPASVRLVSGDAVEVDRVVPDCGNLMVRPQQFWFGPALAGRSVTLWIDTTTVHVSMDGQRIKTLPSRFTVLDLARLRQGDARPAGPPPAPPSPGMLAAGAAVELERCVTSIGCVGLAGRLIPIGSPLAGRRVTLRLEEHLIHVVVDGQLWRTLPSPIPPQSRGRLRGARVAGPPPIVPNGPVRVQRRVSLTGACQVCRQRIQVGIQHARQTVTIEVEQTLFRVLDDRETILKVVPRTNTQEVRRFKAYGHTGRSA